METALTEALLGAVVPHLGWLGIIGAGAAFLVIRAKGYVDKRDQRVERLLREHDHKNDKDFEERRRWEEKADAKMDAMAADIAEVKGYLKGKKE